MIANILPRWLIEHRSRVTSHLEETNRRKLLISKPSRILASHREAFLDDFQQTLDKFKVPAEAEAELKAIVNSTRADIVVASESAVA
jgi:truncated hemoglobin YjbI